MERNGLSARIINMPWLNRVDADWLLKVLDGTEVLYSIENHSNHGGLSDELARVLSADPQRFHAVKLKVMGVEGFAQSGQVDETLHAYHLSVDAIVKSILQAR